MTAITQPYTVTEGRKRLRWLAEHWDDTGEAVRALLLGALLHPSLPVPCQGGTCGQCSACLWLEYQDARRVAADLESGALGWEQVEPDLQCCDKQDHAIEDAAMWAAGIEDVLVNGMRKETGN